MEKNGFEINILQAQQGDCIHLRFWSKDTAGNFEVHNIVIDSGPSANSYNFSELMSQIKARKEYVDLMCFTHIDDDHIAAAEDFLGSHKDAGKLIKQIWINIPQWEIENAVPLEPSLIHTTSVDTAMELYRYILWHKIPCKTQVLEGEKLFMGEVLIRAVLPTQHRIERYLNWWRKKRPPTSNVSLTAAGYDKSITNGSSITLLIEGYGKKMLFSGDAFASDLTKATKKWVSDGFDLVKLPHHGSKANISKRMLDTMKCRYFVISADGSGGRPAQEAIDLLGQYGARNEGIVLYGNYAWYGVKHTKGVSIKMLESNPKRIGDNIRIKTE